MLKEELLKDSQKIINLLICKRLLPNGYGDKELLLETAKILKDESFDTFKIFLISLSKANLWSDLLYVIDKLDTDEESISFVADIFANQLTIDLSKKILVYVLKFHLQKIKNMIKNLI